MAVYYDFCSTKSHYLYFFKCSIVQWKAGNCHLLPSHPFTCGGESHDHIVNNEKKINLRTSINRCMDALPFHTTKRKKKKEKIVKNVHTKACTSSYTWVCALHHSNLLCCCFIEEQSFGFYKLLILCVSTTQTHLPITPKWPFTTSIIGGIFQSVLNNFDRDRCLL